jgi:hypothetical protein
VPISHAEQNLQSDAGRLSDSRQIFSWAGGLASIEVGPIARRSPVHFPTLRLYVQAHSWTRTSPDLEKHPTVTGSGVRRRFMLLHVNRRIPFYVLLIVAAVVSDCSCRKIDIVTNNSGAP